MDLFDKIISLDRMATAFGFTWENRSQLMEQLLSECAEVNEVLHHPEQADHLEEELGDLIFTAIALCVYCGFDPKTTLDKSLIKFQKRFDALQHIALEKGYTTLHQQPMEVLKALWDHAKHSTRTAKSQ